MATSRTQAIILVALFALPLVPATLLVGTAGAASAPALETLQNGSFEGAPGAANGYELERGAETSAVAETGVQSVNLAATGASPTNNTLGTVIAYPTHPVELRHVTSLSYSYNVPREPPFVRLREVLVLDLDGNGMEDACLVAQPSAPLAPTAGWVRRTLDGATSFVVGDVWCPTGGTQRTLADLQTDAVYREAKILRVKLETSTSIGPWPLAPVYVDRASLLATSSPLVRIRDPWTNLCDGASFATVTSALACADAGATILVTPGTYTGTLTVAQPVTLCGTSRTGTDCEDGRTDVVIRGDSPYAALVTSDDVTLRGLVFENPLYAGSDQTTGSRIDPTLIVVDGSRVEIVGNFLRSAAAPLGVGQSRWSTFGVHVQSGDDVVVRGNLIRQLPSSLASNDVCANQPCRTIGVQIGAAATDALVVNNSVDMGATRRAYAIAAEGAGTRIDGNFLRVPGDASTTRNAGIAATGTLGGEIARNIVLRAEGARLGYGILATGIDAPILRNLVTGATDGIRATAAPGATLWLSENAVADSGTGYSLGSNASLHANNVTRATDGIAFTGTGPLQAQLADNVLRSTTTLLRGAATLSDSTIDARGNDWGVYDLQDIQQRVIDAGARNTFDVTCYLDADGATRICPPTPAFTWTPEAPSWNKTIGFTHASVAGGRAITGVTWRFGDGNTSTEPSPTHAYAAPGTYDVSLVVRDGDGTEVTLTRPLAVLNHAPVLAARGPYTVQENQTMTFALQATDADGDNLTYAIAALPDHATFDAPNATFSWRPNFTQAGLHTLTFAANDTFAEGTLDVVVNVTDVNAPPFLQPIGGKTLNEGELLQFYVRASDVDGQRIRLNAFVRPIGATFRDYGNGTGLFTWTPDHQQAGDYPLTFEANDGLLEVRETILIRVANANRAPQFAALPNQTIPEGSLIQFLVSATDVDNDPITYSAPVLPPGATFNATTRRFAWTPNLEQEGIHRVVFNASDLNSSSEIETFIHVTKTNRAPYIDAIAPRAVAFNRTIVFSISGGDPDRDPVTFSMASLPPGASFDPSTRAFTWRPTENDVGRHELTFIADDGNATGTGIGILTVVVNEKPQLTLEFPPRIDTYAEAVFRATAHDPDTNGAVRIEWDFDERNGLTVDRLGGFVTWTYTQPGDYNVTLRAIDRDGVVNLTVVNITVDDSLRIWLDILEPRPDLLTGTQARVTLRLSNGTAVNNTLVNLTMAYQPHPGAPRQYERTMQVLTGEDGTASFFIPRDLPLTNLPGRHVLDAIATVTDSLHGDHETASASITYNIDRL